jgi:hypothetical protein
MNDYFVHFIGFATPVGKNVKGYTATYSQALHQHLPGITAKSLRSSFF